MQHGLEQSLATPRWTGLLAAPPEGFLPASNKGVLTKKRCWIHPPRSLTACLRKMMVGRLLDPFGMTYFQGLC